MAEVKKKLFLNFFFFWAICFGIYWCFVEYVVLPYLHPAGIRGRAKVEYNQKHIPAEEVDYLILGDSSALYSLQPIRMGKKSFSAAELGASVSRAKKLFQNLNLKKINKGVILGQTFIDAHYDEDIWRLFVPQKMMSRQDLIDVFCDGGEPYCSAIDRFLYGAKYVWYRLHLNEHAGSVVCYGVRFQVWLGVQRYIDFVTYNILKNRGHFAARSTLKLDNLEFFRTYRKFYQKAINPPTSELSELIKLQELVSRYNVKLYLLEPHFYLSEGTNVDLYKRSYDEYVAQLKDSGIEFISTKNLNVHLTKDHFADFNHLNEEGAALFTDKLMDYLTRSGENRR